MRRHILQPLDVGGPVGRVGPAGADVDTTCHGFVDDGLLLLLQKRNQLLFGADLAVDPAIDVIEEAGNGGWF